MKLIKIIVFIIFIMAAYHGVNYAVYILNYYPKAINASKEKSNNIRNYDYALKECPKSITSDMLNKLKDKYGSCNIYEASDVNNCRGNGNYYDKNSWMDSVLYSQGGIIIYSDSYIFLNKAYFDGSTLIKGKSWCFDDHGVHNIVVE